LTKKSAQARFGIPTLALGAGKIDGRYSLSLVASNGMGNPLALPFNKFWIDRGGQAPPRTEPGELVEKQRRRQCMLLSVMLTAEPMYSDLLQYNIAQTS
jgi:hypothetical protein